MRFLSFMAVLALWATALPHAGAAQSLTQNASGEGSILLRGSRLSIDVTQTAASFGLNNLSNSVGATNHQADDLYWQPVYGVSASVKSEDELRGLLTNGDFVPSAKLSGFAGASLSNALYPSVERAKDALADKMTQNVKETRIAIQQAIMLRTAGGGANVLALQATLLKSLAGYMFPADIEEDVEPHAGKAATATEVAQVGDDAAQAAARLLIQQDVTTILNTRNAVRDALEVQIETLESTYDQQTFWHLIIFGFAGAEATEFKRYTSGANAEVLSKNFSDVSFRGGRIGLGANLQYSIFLFGLRYARVNLNNFDDLTKREYVLTTTVVNVNGTQKLVQERKLSAYSGDYGATTGTLVQGDVIINTKLDHGGLYHSLINPYFRYQRANNTVLLPKTTDIGCGLYFFKRTGKFMGGLYGELADINNNVEESKPEADRDLRKSWQRLSFGLVATLTIGSLLDTF